MTQVFVPTLDINLVMQVHQLSAAEYRNQCCRVLGMIPDNNVRLYVSRAEGHKTSPADQYSLQTTEGIYCQL